MSKWASLGRHFAVTWYLSVHYSDLVESNNLLFLYLDYVVFIVILQTETNKCVVRLLRLGGVMNNQGADFFIHINFVYFFNEIDSLL